MTEKAKKVLPEGWHWVGLKQVCEVNPRRARELDRSDEMNTRFVPMAAVDDVTGKIAAEIYRPFGEVKKGYTYFEEGDVLFAKITPCMENGKHAVARGLKGGFGFGTTEFHVLRPAASLHAEWLHFYLRRPEILRELASHASGAVGQQRIQPDVLADLAIPLPPLSEQKRIASILSEQLAAVERARRASADRLDMAETLAEAYIRQSYETGNSRKYSLAECLVEVSKGIGKNWRKFPVLGATRNGLALARESVGKNPERYKLVDEGTIFYNPMRILIGSIAMVDEFGKAGITSPDYVVLKSRPELVNVRWFYYWLRSSYGEHFIKSMARGAVRERMLFNRLSEGIIALPDIAYQNVAAEKMKHISTLVEKIKDEYAAISGLSNALLRQTFTGTM